ncbi:MAG: SusC/RagA family TonB-linked outer membrane protein, partial [Tannerella sp.]|nr:SusC/RagA family TonB-linked outer membrane protein [Tannerella sp.]
MKDFFSEALRLPHINGHLFRKMKGSFILLLLSVCAVLAENTHSQETKVSLHVAETSIKEIIHEIERTTNYVFVLSDQVEAEVDKKVNVNTDGMPLSDILDKILAGTQLSYNIIDKQVVVYADKTKKVHLPEKEPDVAVVQQPAKIKITGIIMDTHGYPLISANVIEIGTTNGVAADMNGGYTISVSPGATLRFSYLGYKTKEAPVGNDNVLNVELEEDQESLNEVVVVGYGTQKKVNMTGSVSSVKMDALSDRPVTNVTNVLAGLAAGLSISNSGGNTPGFESKTIRIRGQGTLNDSSPLIVIDGSTGAALSDINPQDVEAISILKDAASSAIYGSRAANGVILITTRKGMDGSARITYSGNVSLETVAKRLNLVTDYADFMEIQNAGLIANGQAARFSQGKIDEWRNDAGKNPTVYPNTDWQDHIYRNPSVVQNHTISAIGGSGTIRYNLSFGYTNNPGMVYHTDYERYQLRSNIDVDIKPWLTVGANLFGYIDMNDPSADVAAAGGDVIWGSGAFNSVPGMTLYDPETGLYGGIQNPEEENVSNFNPYRRMWFYKSEFPTRTRRSVAKMYGRLR